MPAAAAVRPNGPCTGTTRTTGLEQLRQAGVDIFDGDVAQPGWAPAALASAGRFISPATADSPTDSRVYFMPGMPTSPVFQPIKLR